MPPLMQLPAYQSNALLDFTPLNQGIQQYKADAEKARRQQVAQQAGNALMGGDYKGAMGTALAGDRADLAGLALQAKGQASSEASQEIDREHKLAQMYGGAAQRVLETKDPKLWGAILNSHPEMGAKLRRAGIDPNDHINGAQFLMSQAQGYRNPLDDQLKKAQISNLYASAEARKALANYRDGKAPVAEVPDPLNGWGADKDGYILPPKGPAISPLKGVSPPAVVPDGVVPRDATGGVGRFSPGASVYSDVRGDATTLSPGSSTAVQRSVGRRNDTVPGVVLDQKGRSDRYASETLAGQEAMEQRASTPEDQQRLMRHYQVQQMWATIRGKPPAGFIYNDQGGLEDLRMKNTATERAQRVAAEDGLKTLEHAERLLSKAGTLDQLRGDTYSLPGGVKVGGFGEAGRGFRAAEAAVLKLNFALSGKSVSNAEREHFLRIYMPTAFDSAETQQWKFKQLREFFTTVNNARLAGMDDDRRAELYRRKIEEGTAANPADAPKKVDPVKQRLMNKYGLE